MNKRLLKPAFLVPAVVLLATSAQAQVCGSTVYDTGGAGGNYGNLQNYTVTYCPPVAGQAVSITFSSFATEAGYDFLSIHNGTTNGSAQLGIFSGTTNPGTFTSTDPSGCLTLWFTSDLTVTAAGWVATIACVPLPPPPPVCGTTVYDPGGAAGNYPNNANWTTTYCPTVAGEVVNLNFSAFSTEANYDFLTVYNGPNTGAPSMGTYSGGGIPGPFTSTHPSGCITLAFTSDGSVNYPGWTATVNCITPPPPPAGDCIYTLTLQDSYGDGWGSSNVGVSINGGPYQYYTVAGFFNQVVFGVDIGNVVVITYNNSGPWQGENSFTLTMSGGGMLYNSGTPPSAGIVYTGVVDCITPAAPVEDCVGGMTLCSNQSIVNNTNNTGNVADLNLTSAGCLSNLERQGTWYNFSPSTTGTLAFTISPANPADDYDFAIWGPYPEGSTTATICPPLGAPLRCSYAAPSGDTGLSFGAADLTEGAGGDKWVRYLDVVEGQVYLMYISNWSQSGLAFNLNFNPGSTASLDCTVLPVALLGLEAMPLSDAVELRWATASEQNSDHFLVERASGPDDFETIGYLPAAGNSQQTTAYRFTDARPNQGINYYRLRQVDNNGDSQHSNTVHAVFKPGGVALHVLPNPAHEQLEVLLNTPLENTPTVRITDAAGRLVSEQRPAIGEQGTRVPVALHRLDAGVYTISLVDERGTPLGHARFVRD
ncbi:MAG: T9SS type A sorting domain-containing protein [Flavobacteriales bacterium]|nr:T9SS type A sorting domain-containing protein [Flavobacteriales bacterium]